MASIGSKSAAIFWPASSAFSKRSQGADGRSSTSERAGLGQEIALGILGADAAFDRVAALGDWLRADCARPRPAAISSCSAHEIEAGDHLGDGMLDLQAGVHLEEEEAPVGAENEFDRAGVAVARRRREPHRGGADVVAQRRRQARRRRFLDDLLEAALHRAFALEQMDRIALAVADDLHLDVARPLDIGLGVDAAVAEIALRLAGGDARGLPRVRRRERTMLMPLPPPPAAALISSGKPIASRSPRKASRSPVGVDRRRDRHAVRAREIAGGDLVAHQRDRLGVGADEDEPGRRHRRGEARRSPTGSRSRDGWRRRRISAPPR